MAKVFYLVMCLVLSHVISAKYVDKRKCPEVKAAPHFDLPRMPGDWCVVEYYASAEEALSYSCMKAVFTQDDHVPTADGSVEFTPGVTMNFTYRFADDPLGENLLGNITWRVDLNEPAHWTHAERTYDGIYNTYVLDLQYKTRALLLHCPEQTEGARYLSAFVLSRTTVLPKNAMAYLRDKRPSCSCAKDIARIVNRDHGKVVLYGVQESSELAIEPRKKRLTSSPGVTLLHELQGLNIHTVKEQWYNHVVKGNYETAVIMAQNFGTTGGEFINETVMRLISSAPQNVMSLAYKLWHGGATKDIVRNYFPQPFQHIFNEDAVTIVNKRYRQPLKLDMDTDSINDRLAWGDNNQCQITSDRVSWKLIPVWNRDGVIFKLYNIHRNMYLKLDLNVDNMRDRQAWGSTESDEFRHRFYLEPLVKNGNLVFFIINCQYNQGLKLDLNTDNIGDRLVWGHDGSVHNEDERFRWVIAAW